MSAVKSTVRPRRTPEEQGIGALRADKACVSAEDVHVGGAASDFSVHAEGGEQRGTPIAPRVRSFADLSVKLGSRRHVFSARPARELRRFSGARGRARKPQVSAEFSVKRSRAFCARLAKDRTRDNASLSAPKETEANHDWRDHRV